MTICYYHKEDLDGHCSGAIVKYVHKDCRMFGVDYQDNPDLNEVDENEDVYVVDFCFSKEEILALQRKAKNLVWIDHHKSSIEKMNGHSFKGIRRIGIAACELTWDYFFNHKKGIPKAVTLLGRYDVWDHENPMVLSFQ